MKASFGISWKLHRRSILTVFFLMCLYVAFADAFGVQDSTVFRVLLEGNIYLFINIPVCFIGFPYITLWRASGYPRLSDDR